MSKTLEKISNSSKDFFIYFGFKDYDNRNKIIYPLNKFIYSRSISNNIKSKFIDCYKGFFKKEDPLIIYKRDNSEIKNSLNSILLQQKKNKKYNSKLSLINETPKNISINTKKKILTNYLKNLNHPKEELKIEFKYKHKNNFPIPYSKRNNSFRMMTNKILGNENTFLSRNKREKNYLFENNNSRNNHIILTQQSSRINNIKMDGFRLRMGLTSF